MILPVLAAWLLLPARAADLLPGVPAWSATGGANLGRLGAGVAVVDLDGDRAGEVLLGTPGLSELAESAGGAVLFDSTAGGPGDVPAWAWQCGVAWLSMGTRVAAAGDLDGDGQGDVLVAGPDAANASAGGVFLFRGEGEALAAAAAVDYHQGGGESDYGMALAGDLDLDGDGAPEFAVGAPGSDESSGRVFVYDSTSTAAAWEQRGTFPGQALGRALTAGDVDGDGYADLAISAQTSDAATQGAVHVYAGGAGGLGDAQPSVASGLGSGGECGAALAAGDLDADGFADVVVGCPWQDVSVAGEGTVLLLAGAISGLSAVPSWAPATGEIAGALGASLAVGDWDADGALDLAAGAPSAVTGSGAGGVALFAGAAWGATTATQVLSRRAATAGFGDALSAGDLDANGQDDLLVADSYGADGRGQVFAFVGDAPDSDSDGDPDGLDCDDADAAVNRWADEEWCDGVDSDCDGDDNCVGGECVDVGCLPEDSAGAGAGEDGGCGCGAGGAGGGLAAVGAGLASLMRRRKARRG